MGTHRRLRHKEPLGDLGRREALAQQLEDLPLPTRQFGISVADDQTAAPWTRIAKLGDDPAHERTWDCGVAAQRVGKGMRQALTGNVFQEVAAGAREES